MLNKNTVTRRSGVPHIFTIINLSNDAFNGNRKNWNYLWSVNLHGQPVSYTFNSLTNMRNVSITFNGTTNVNSNESETIELICQIIVPTNTLNPIMNYSTRIKLI